MEKRVRATAVRCNVTGELGLVLDHHMQWYKTSDSYVAGFSLGHEILAHQKGETGTVWEEMRALGTEAWLSQYFSEYNTGIIQRLNFEILGGDLVTTLMDFLNSPSDIPEAPKVSKLYDEHGSLYDFFDSAFRSMSLAEEFKDFFDQDEDLTAWFNKIKPLCFGWFVHGYRKAEKVRYRNFDPYDVFLTRKAINDLRIKPEYEGQRFVIYYNLADSTARYRELRGRVLA